MSFGMNGPTAKSGGMLRTYHPDSYLSDLAYESMPHFMNFEQLYGSSCGYTKTGLIVVEPAERLDAVKKEVERINRQSPVLEWKQGPGDAFGSSICTGKQDIAIFEERAGYANPSLTAQAWVNFSRGCGMDAMEGIAVTELMVKNGKATGVRTTAGNIAADIIIVAAGAWSKKIVEQAIGRSAPIRSKAIQMDAFIRPDKTEAPLPFTDYTNQLYGKQGAGSVHMIGLPVDQWDIDPDQEEAVDPVLAEHTRVCAAGRLDWVKGALYAGGKRSFDAYCTNGRGWTGQVDGVEGLLVCTGWGAEDLR